MSKHTRREFLEKTIYGAVGAGMGLSALRPAALLAEPFAAGNNRGYTAGRFALQINGMMAGWVESVEGGHATGDVVTENLGPDQIAKKHISGVKYEDIVVNCGTGMSKDFYEWIKATFDHRLMRKNGAVITADYNDKEVSRLEWMNALISEVGLPALDASSKDAARMSVKITPEQTRMSAQGGQAVSGLTSRGAQKKWLSSNFRLTIPGLRCDRVNRIEAIVLRQAQQNTFGQARSYQGVAGNTAAPRLAVALAESDAQDWYKWHQSFVQGNHGAGSEKSGTLEYLAPNLEPLFTLHFENLGISSLGADMRAGRNGIKSVQAEMYCQKIRFDYSNAAWA